MTNVRWEVSGHALAEPPTERALRGALHELSEGTDQWVGVFRGNSKLYVSRLGDAYDVTYWDERDATWRVWASDPRDDAAGERPDRDRAIAWALEFVVDGSVPGVMRDSEEDRIAARDVKALAVSEITELLRSWDAQPIALELHVHRPRREVALGVSAGDWQRSSPTTLTKTSAQLALLAREAPWSLGDRLLETFVEALRALDATVPSAVLRVLVLDDLPIEHAIAMAEVLHGGDATKAWRAAVLHDTARLWAYRAEVKKLGGSMTTPATAPPNKASQTGFDFG